MAKTILVVENDPKDLHRLELFLKAEAYQITSTQDADLALHLIQNEPFDLIIYNDTMPGMSGFVFINLLKKQDSTKNIPVLLLTTGRSNNPGFTIHLPTPHTIPKPLDIPQLLIKIQQILA